MKSKKKYVYINYFKSCIIIFLQNHHALQYTSANATLVFEIRHRPSTSCFVTQICLPQFSHQWTTLPSILLYSHHHTDHHKRLTFFCEFHLEGLFPRLRIQYQHAVWTESLKTLPLRCALGEDCKHLCVKGEVWWKRDTMRLHRTSFIQICLM
jgi:hypothetical protein